MKHPEIEWALSQRKKQQRDIRKRFTRYKVYFDRSRMYISYVQSFLLLLVLMEAYKETAFGIWFYDNKWITLPVFLVMFMGVSMLIGYLDKRYIRPGEQDELIESNPPWTNMRDKINDLHDKLCK